MYAKLFIFSCLFALVALQPPRQGIPTDKFVKPINKDLGLKECDNGKPGTQCPTGCCPEENWFCCPDGYYCATADGKCPEYSTLSPPALRKLYGAHIRP